MKTKVETDGNNGRIYSKISCPSCGAKVDGFTGVEKDAQKPSDGDLSICMYCASIGKYADNLTQIRLITAEELTDLKRVYPADYYAIQQTVDKIKEFIKSKKV